MDKENFNTMLKKIENTINWLNALDDVDGDTIKSVLGHSPKELLIIFRDIIKECLTDKVEGDYLWEVYDDILGEFLSGVRKIEQDEEPSKFTVKQGFGDLTKDPSIFRKKR